MEEKRYKPQQFAEMLGVSVATLQRWDRESILHAHRTPTNRRYYTHAQYLEYIKREGKPDASKSDERHS